MAELPKTTIEDAHRCMVAGLVKSGADIVAQMEPSTAHLLHMAVGIVGEVAELASPIYQINIDVGKERENLIEEFGDLEFYVEGFRAEIEAPITQVEISPEASDDTPEEAKATFIRLVIEAGNLLDAVKKVAIYNKPMDRDLLEHRWSMVALELRRLEKHLRVPHRAALEANYAKLGKRYENHVYSDQQAQDRADKAE